MDHILAKIKRLTKNPFAKLISDHTLYEGVDPKITDCVPYSPDHNLDDDSWFKVEKISQQPYCLDIVKADFDSKDYNDLKKEQFLNIAYIISIQSGDFYFQKITSSLFLKRKIIGFGETVTIEEGNNRLIINKLPDAIYFKKIDTLYFRNLATISGIFKGIDCLYREATQQETEFFLQEDFIKLENNYTANSVSKPNRKRIALAMDALATMSEKDKSDIINYIGTYCDKNLIFNKKTKKFEISTDKELKLLLYGVEQRFYTTLVGEERRIANSVRTVDS
ncbi:hypothetical protein F471_03778 [Pseudomonas sp. URMO17WK12:I1]|uniref:hypothetical protein n=1 Tax=unclassified Pseudomonas TaxID=196821 RepID=UPI0004852FC2|nr:MULTISPECIES: hypothetical protein [unclassified Pseudomonas]PZW65299.1 hypothetical protein F471_03778 [Pseudomonas sp. URMO17WK12:I1]